MKDPVRLLEGETSETERALLRAGAAEQPPRGARRRLGAALGLGVAASGISAAAHAKSGAKAAWFSAASGKLGLVGLAAGGIGAAWAAVALVRSQHPEPVPPEPAASAPVVDSEAREVAPAQPAGLREQAEAALAQPRTEAPRAREPSRPSRQPPTAREAPGKAASMAREIARIDRARSLLWRERPRATLKVLARYERKHPRGALQQEAERLRIEALARVREPEEARRRARRFLREHPDSAHVGRVREILEGLPDAP